MTFQRFLDDYGVTDIDPIFSQVMDEVGEPIVRASYGPPSATAPTMPPASLVTAIPAALAAKQKQSPDVAAGATLLMTACVADIGSVISATLTAGAAGLLKVPPLGVPAPPVIPSALAAGPSALNPGFGLALLAWAVSLLPPGDLRIIVPFIAP